MTKFALVGDVRGTNARLTLYVIWLESGEISRAKTYSGLDYPSLEAVVRVYLGEHQVTTSTKVVLPSRMPDYRRLGGDDQPYTGFLYRRNEAQPRHAPSGDN